jgi:hypothetical protein
MLVSVQVSLVPADAQSPVQPLTSKPEFGTAVQVLLPPAATLVGLQLTEPFPPETEAETL